MITGKEIYDAIDSFAPFHTAEDFDNVGILYHAKKEIKKILFALDISEDTILEAAELGCEALVTHHPVMLGGVTHIEADEPIALAIKHDITLIAAHTNYDKAAGGINDVLARKIGIRISGEFCDGLGRICHLDHPMDSRSFALFIKEKLNLDTVSAVICDKMVQTVAVAGGSSDFIRPALEAGADALITGELKYHHGLKAKRLGLTAVAAGHFSTEDPGLRELKARLETQFSDKVTCFYSSRGKDPFCFM